MISPIKLLKDITTKQALGLNLWALAVLQFGLVYLNTYARAHGGHDLTPLLSTASLMMIGGFGLIFTQRWIRLVSSILLASGGIWSIVHTFLKLGFVPQMVFTAALDCALCIPLLITVRGLMRSKDKPDFRSLPNAN